MDVEKPEQFLDSRLDKLDEKQLFSSELFSNLSTTGQVQTLTHRSIEGGKSRVSFVSFDEAVLEEGQLDEKFQYFPVEDLNKYYSSVVLSPEKSKRPLMHGSIGELDPELLFIGMFETNKDFRGKGLGVAYQERLYKIAKNLGYRFIAGYQNDTETAKFFLGRGRYLLDELQDEQRRAFVKKLAGLDNPSQVIYTIKFLVDSDIKKMVRPNRVGTTVEDKIDLIEKSQLLDVILRRCNQLYIKNVNTKGVSRKSPSNGDIATIIEVLTDLNFLLPVEFQYKHENLSEDDPQIVTALKGIFRNIHNNRGRLLDLVSIKQLRENDKAL